MVVGVILYTFIYRNAEGACERVAEICKEIFIDNSFNQFMTITDHILINTEGMT